MNPWQHTVRAACSRMTREEVAERLECSVELVDKYLAGKIQHPRVPLAARMRRLSYETTNGSGNYSVKSRRIWYIRSHDRKSMD